MQENHENNQLIQKTDSTDNICDEHSGDKSHSTSKIFLFVLALHILVIVSAIGLHMMRAAYDASNKHSTAGPLQTNQHQTSSVQSSTFDQASEPKSEYSSTSLQNSSATSTDYPDFNLAVTENLMSTASEHDIQPDKKTPLNNTEKPLSSIAVSNNPSSSEEVIYIVRPGDTLDVIARRHNTTIAQILSDNLKKNEKIAIGERLIIRLQELNSAISSGSPQPQPKAVELVAAKVQQQHLPINNLIAKKPTVASQRLAQEADNETKVQSAKKFPTRPTAEDLRLYTVKKGDTLFRISKNYGISIDDIKKWNQLDSDKLSVGKVLRLTPHYPESAHTLANTADNTQRKTFPFNPNAIKPETVTSASIQYTSSDTNPSGNIIKHIVSAGETLSSLARKYNTTVESIKLNNALSTDFLTIGQKLAITQGGTNSLPQKHGELLLTHLVRPGETLSSISKTYGVPIEAITVANHLRNPNIKIGQKLVIPNQESEKPGRSIGTTEPASRRTDILTSPTHGDKKNEETYIVQPGDTLFKIALKFGVTVESLSTANNIGSTDILRVGQELNIPKPSTSEVAKSGM